MFTMHLQRLCLPKLTFSIFPCGIKSQVRRRCMKTSLSATKFSAKFPDALRCSISHACSIEWRPWSQHYVAVDTHVLLERYEDVILSHLQSMWLEKQVPAPDYNILQQLNCRILKRDQYSRLGSYHDYSTLIWMDFKVISQAAVTTRCSLNTYSS